MNHYKFMRQLKKLLVEHGVKSFGSCSCCDGTEAILSDGNYLYFLDFREGKLSAMFCERKGGQKDTSVSV